MSSSKSPAESLVLFIRCIAQGRRDGKPGHDFDEAGKCRRCTAQRSDPLLIDLLIKEADRDK